MEQRRTIKPKSKNEKTLTICWTLHSNGNKDRLYLRRKRRRKKLTSVDDCVNVENYNLKGKATERNPKVIESCVIGENTWEEKMKEGRNQLHGKKVLHSKFVLRPAAEEIRGNISWDWLLT